VVEVGELLGGGILKLLSVLKDHWGAVERDLLAAGLHLHFLGTDRLSLGELCSFVLNSPPNTAVFHALTEGYGVSERLQARTLDALNFLAWTKSEDAHEKNPQHRPEPTWIPGMNTSEPEQPFMTVSDYMTLTEGD
jgi:hypothetical protein